MKRELGRGRTECWKGYTLTDENGMKQDKRGLLGLACTMCVILGHRDRRGRKLKGHQPLPVRYTLSHVICTTDLWDRNLHPHSAGKPATRFTTKFKWKVLLILWHFLPRCSEISWFVLGSGCKFIQSPSKATDSSLWLIMCPIYHLACATDLLGLNMYLWLNEWMESVNEWKLSWIKYKGLAL